MLLKRRRITLVIKQQPINADSVLDTKQQVIGPEVDTICGILVIRLVHDENLNIYDTVSEGGSRV